MYNLIYVPEYCFQWLEMYFLSHILSTLNEKIVNDNICIKVPITHKNLAIFDIRFHCIFSVTRIGLISLTVAIEL